MDRFYPNQWLKMSGFNGSYQDHMGENGRYTRHMDNGNHMYNDDFNYNQMNENMNRFHNDH